MATRKRTQGGGAKKRTAGGRRGESARSRSETARKAPAGEATKKGTKKAPAGVLVWEDDPMSGLPPITRPVPDISEAPLATRITDAAAPEAGVYAVGTQEFRYWAAAEALRRAADFWGRLLPAGLRWFTGADLPVTLDRGAELNAYYDRRGLQFFHENVAGTTVYSGESPDIVCHEFGHAVLDAVRPQLWDVVGIEAAAFHEAFGDVSAILCALELPSVRVSILAETGGRIYRNSRLSRLGEQLGWGIRHSNPHLVDPDSLRNAVNSFFYRDPETLPPSAPAYALSTEPHSFSRIFTASFLEALGVMLRAISGEPTAEDLLKVSRNAGRILLDAVTDAPVVPDYFTQVAAHMVEAAEGTPYKEGIQSTFVRRGILSLKSASTMNTKGASVSERRGIASMVPVEAEKTGEAPVPQIPLAISEYGLSVRALMVSAPGQTKRLPVKPAAVSIGSMSAPSEEVAARSFVEDLFRRGRVDIKEHGEEDSETVHPFTRKTHELSRQGDSVILVRRTFDCGFDAF
ncbi:MAG TPA: hypothetical protein VF507_05120 [Pyrinomonadaceae bacterium]|jgi:hypothetical protein